jgi:hypothetical protein
MSGGRSDLQHPLLDEKEHNAARLNTYRMPDFSGASESQRKSFLKGNRDLLLFKVGKTDPRYITKDIGNIIAGYLGEDEISQGKDEDRQNRMVSAPLQIKLAEARSTSFFSLCADNTKGRYVRDRASDLLGFYLIDRYQPSVAEEQCQCVNTFCLGLPAIAACLIGSICMPVAAAMDNKNNQRLIDLSPSEPPRHQMR